jgi:hypothetical protein
MEESRPVVPEDAKGARWMHLPRLAVAAGLVAAFCLAAGMTWERWGDVIIDCGRELDTPKQLLAGKMLYRDVRYWYGPLAPYANALLYQIFGVRVSTLTTAGLVSAALLAWLAYRTMRHFTGRAGAGAAVASLLFISCFGHYYLLNLYQFPLPYSYPATYGIVAAVASLYFLLRYNRRERPVDFFTSCGFFALTALCKIEVLVAVMAMHAIFFFCRVIARRPLRSIHFAGYVLALAIPVGVYACFYSYCGASLWSDNLFITGNLSAKKYLLEHLGLKNPAQTLREIALSAGAIIGCLVIVWLATRGEQILLRGRWLVGLVAGAACGGILWMIGPHVVFRIEPLLLVILIVAHLHRLRKDASASIPTTAWILLFTLALACMLRILFRAGTEHYGFYLFVPGLMAWAVFWLALAPRVAARQGLPYSRAAYSAAIAMLLVSAGLHAQKTRANAAFCYGDVPTLRIRTPAGTLPCDIGYKGTVNKAVGFLFAKGPQTTVVVMPEGAGITFLAGCTNALGLHTFLPVDLCGSYGDAEMVRRLEQARPDYIVLDSRDVSEYGKTGLGIDYGLAIGPGCPSTTTKSRTGTPNTVACLSSSGAGRIKPAPASPTRGRPSIGAAVESPIRSPRPAGAKTAVPGTAPKSPRLRDRQRSNRAVA